MHIAYICYIQCMYIHIVATGRLGKQLSDMLKVAKHISTKRRMAKNPKYPVSMVLLCQKMHFLIPSFFPILLPARTTIFIPTMMVIFPEHPQLKYSSYLGAGQHIFYVNKMLLKLYCFGKLKKMTFLAPFLYDVIKL